MDKIKTIKDILTIAVAIFTLLGGVFFIVERSEQRLRAEIKENKAEIKDNRYLIIKYIVKAKP